MAQITWMNVPIPDIGGTEQQGIRTAADLLGSAARSAATGVAGLQAIQDQQQAAEVAAADRFALENMLSTQDPNAYQKMRADGSLLGPAASKVSNATLLAAEQRGNQLYDLDRQRTDQRELRDAQAVFDKAAALASYSPDAAQEEMAKAHFSNAERSAQFAKDIRGLYIPPDGEAARRKNEERTREAYRVVDQVLGMGKDNPEGIGKFLDSVQDPLVKGMAVDRLFQLKQPVDTYYGSERTPNYEGTTQVVEGVDQAMGRQFGPNEKFVAMAAKQGNYFPGSPEWMAQTGRVASMADVHDWQEKYVKPFSKEERAKDGKEPTTAVGPYQITNSTRRDFVSRYGKQLFGTDDMSKVPFTPENEDKLAGKIYEVQGPGAWQATQNYAGLKDGKAFKGKSWEDSKPLMGYIDGGVAPASYAPQIKQLEAKLQQRELDLGEGAKVIRNARPNESWGLNQAAENLVKSFGKDTRPGEARELVEKTVRKAKEAGTVITYAEAVELIKNSIRDDGNLISTGIFAGKIPTVSDLNDDLDLEESKLVQSAKDLGNARADLKSHEKKLEDLKTIQELSKKYGDEMAAAKKALTLAEYKSDAGVSALNSFRRWQDTSNQLARKLAASLRPEVSSQEGTPRPDKKQGDAVPDGFPYTGNVNRVSAGSNVDLMLDPKKPSAVPDKFGSNQFNSR